MLTILWQSSHKRWIPLPLNRTDINDSSSNRMWQQWCWVTLKARLEKAIWSPPGFLAFGTTCLKVLNQHIRNLATLKSQCLRNLIERLYRERDVWAAPAVRLPAQESDMWGSETSGDSSPQLESLYLMSSRHRLAVPTELCPDCKYKQINVVTIFKATKFGGTLLHIIRWLKHLLKVTAAKWWS